VSGRRCGIGQRPELGASCGDLVSALINECAQSGVEVTYFINVRRLTNASAGPEHQLHSLALVSRPKLIDQSGTLEVGRLPRTRPLLLVDDAKNPRSVFVGRSSQLGPPPAIDFASNRGDGGGGRNRRDGRKDRRMNGPAVLCPRPRSSGRSVPGLRVTTARMGNRLAEMTERRR
jgi:hypothetical protein